MTAFDGRPKDDSFWEFAHPLVHALMEKNERVKEAYGWQERWDEGSEPGTLIFSNAAGPIWQARYSTVGTTVGDCWEWAWANPHIPDAEKKDIEAVIAFGEKWGYEQLTEAFLKADDFTGWTMSAVAAHILDAHCAYRLPTKSGFFYLVFREIGLVDAENGSNVHGAMGDAVAVAPGADLNEGSGEVRDVEH